MYQHRSWPLNTKCRTALWITQCSVEDGSSVRAQPEGWGPGAPRRSRSRPQGPGGPETRGVLSTLCKPPTLGIIELPAVLNRPLVPKTVRCGMLCAQVRMRWGHAGKLFGRPRATPPGTAKSPRSQYTAAAFVIGAAAAFVAGFASEPPAAEQAVVVMKNARRRPESPGRKGHLGRAELSAWCGKDGCCGDRGGLRAAHPGQRPHQAGKAGGPLDVSS
jgi:hypothetical protein